MHTTKADPVGELLQTYGETGGINYLDAAALLPSREAVELACADLLSLMFPGFRGEPLIDSTDLADITRSRVRSLRSRLKTEICKSLGSFPPNAETEKRADQILDVFIASLPDVRNLVIRVAPVGVPPIGLRPSTVIPSEYQQFSCRLISARDDARAHRPARPARSVRPSPPVAIQDRSHQGRPGLKS